MPQKGSAGTFDSLIPPYMLVGSIVFLAVGGMMSHLGSFGQIFMPKNPEQAASLILALGGMGAFFIGRLFGAYLMKFVRPEKLLGIYAVKYVAVGSCCRKTWLAE